MGILTSEFGRTFIFGITVAVTLGVAVPIVAAGLSLGSPVQVWDELKKGNQAVGIVMAGLAIAFAVIIGFFV